MLALDEAYELHAKLIEANSKEEVAAIMVGASFPAFMELDERPGQFPGRYTDENWHPWLRQLRNDPKSSLFENFA